MKIIKQVKKNIYKLIFVQFVAIATTLFVPLAFSRSSHLPEKTNTRTSFKINLGLSGLKHGDVVMLSAGMVKLGPESIISDARCTELLPPLTIPARKSAFLPPSQLLPPSFVGYKAILAPGWSDGSVSTVITCTWSSSLTPYPVLAIRVSPVLSNIKFLLINDRINSVERNGKDIIAYFIPSVPDD